MKAASLAACRAIAIGMLACSMLPGTAQADESTPAAEGAPAATAPANALPKPLKAVSPHHPPALLERKISGDADIECVVNERGEVTEARVKSATHPEFGEAALAAVQQWHFVPGMKDGHPVATRVSVPFNFEVPDTSSLDAFLKRKVFHEISEPIVPAEEIGSWPMPKMLIEPNYPKALAGSGKRGKAVVSIVIGKDGKVINPKLVKATFPEFEFPALAAAASMEFPPQLNAKKEKIYVSMDVQFDFREAGRPKPKPPPAPAAPAAKSHEDEPPQ